MRPPNISVHIEALHRRAGRWQEAYWAERRRANRALERLDPNRVSDMLAAHRYVIGGGRNSAPDYCSYGDWRAKSLTDVEANDRDWRAHMAHLMVIDPGDDDPVVPTSVWTEDDLHKAVDDLWSCIAKADIDCLDAETVALARDVHASLWHGEARGEPK